jgi:serine/threonine protein kinase
MHEFAGKDRLLWTCQASRLPLVPWYSSDYVSTFRNGMAQAIHAIGTYIAHGASGIVERQGEVVTKQPWPNNNSSLQELEIEARIYQHLGSHPRIVPFLSWDPEQSILRTKYMENGNLRSYISSHQGSTEGRTRWIKQAADTIEVSHTTKQKCLIKAEPCAVLA